MDIKNSPTCDDINILFNEIDGESKTEQHNVLQRLQAIRLWQLKQQEELKKQQLTQLALLKSQSFEKTSLKVKVDSDMDNKDHQEEDDILAVPLENFPGSFSSSVEQSTIFDNGDSNTQENKINSNLDDSILIQLQENMHALEENASIKQKNIFSAANEIFDQENNKHICSESQKNLSLHDNELQSDVEMPLHDNQELHTDVETSFEKVSAKELHSDIEASFEKVCSNMPVSFDDIPIKAGKTFEEILSVQLAQESTFKIKKPDEVSTPKRPFLRKGQGIARFNGPPKRSKVKKKPVVHKVKNEIGHVIEFKETTSHDNLTENNTSDNGSLLTTVEVIDNSVTKTGYCYPGNIEIKSKPFIRKTARLIQKEPIKSLILKPDTKSFAPVKVKALSELEVQQQNYNNDSIWSDSEDTVLALETTEVNDYNTTSNETFEQMEKFCYEHYADLSTVKTLDDDDSVLMKKIDPLPPNKLMLRLFPSLRDNTQSITPSDTKTTLNIKEDLIPDKQIPKKQVDSDFPVSNVQSTNSCNLKSKLEEMEAEIKHFQEESAKLTSVRKQEENQLHLLKQEFEEFQRQKEDELKRLSEFKKSEMKKLKKERKLFEDHVAATKSLPNKRDREYIQELERKITDLQNDHKLKEQRINAVSSRLRSQLDVATEENVKLKAKVNNLKDELSKLKHEKELKKNKQSQIAWKAINDIVDSIPMNHENAENEFYGNKSESKVTPMPMPFRSPLSDINHTNQLNNSQITVHDGKTEHRKKDGSVEIAFQNGTKKFVFPDGTTQVKFTNGDIKTIHCDGTVNYHYTSSGTLHTTHPNGMQVIEFNNKQIERHFPDGSKHIAFEDGSSKMIKLDGSEETIYPDGTVMTVSPNGDKKIDFSNGQREIHTSEFKRREYPDGTCKTVFSDGRQETRYSSGRLRIKDPNGKLLIDKVISV